jgi:hypothetical protein
VHGRKLQGLLKARSDAPHVGLAWAWEEGSADIRASLLTYTHTRPPLCLRVEVASPTGFAHDYRGNLAVVDYPPTVFIRMEVRWRLGCCPPTPYACQVAGLGHGVPLKTIPFSLDPLPDDPCFLSVPAA